MKIFAVLFFLLVCLGSCDTSMSNSKSKESHSYFIFSQLRNGTRFKIDTSSTFQYDDSAAYLEGSRIFGRYMTEFELGHLGRWMPDSFWVLNENQQSIKNNLNTSTLAAIDSIAKIKIARERNNIYDTSGNIRIFDSAHRGLLHLLDSITK